MVKEPSTENTVKVGFLFGAGELLQQIVYTLSSKPQVKQLPRTVQNFGLMRKTNTLKFTLLREIHTLKGNFCGLTRCSDACSGIKSGLCSDTSSIIKAGKRSSLCSDIFVGVCSDIFPA